MSPFDPAPFVERRQRFAAAIGDALAIVPGARELRRNGDVNYEFRQASDFFFLTGFDEPDAVAVFNPADAKERFVLFVRPRDREMEIWTGRRAGVEGAIATYGADAAYTIDRLDEKLREYMVDRPVVFYRLGSGAFDGRVTRLVADLRAARARGHAAPVRIEDPGPLLHELRLRRSPAELLRHRRACEISRDAHTEAMRYARPGLRYEAIHEAARRVLVEGLVALGALPRGVAESLAMHHYREFYMHGTGHWLGMDVHDVGDYKIDRKSRVLEPGMVLTVEPGLYFDPDRETVTYHLREYSEDEMWERRLRFGAAAAKKMEDEEKAKVGTIVHPVPQGLRGIGIRIEDDVLITPDGCDVLTAGTPKTVDEIERACAETPRLPRS